MRKTTCTLCSWIKDLRTRKLPYSMQLTRPCQNSCRGKHEPTFPHMREASFSISFHKTHSKGQQLTAWFPCFTEFKTFFFWRKFTQWEPKKNVQVDKETCITQNPTSMLETFSRIRKSICQGESVEKKSIIMVFHYTIGLNDMTL